MRDLPITEALKLYGIGRQAKDGNNKDPKPSMMKITDRLQWNAWRDQKGKSRKQAAEEFVEFSTMLLDRLHVDYTDWNIEPKKKEFDECVKKHLALGHALSEITAEPVEVIDPADLAVDNE